MTRKLLVLALIWSSAFIALNYTTITDSFSRPTNLQHAEIDLAAVFYPAPAPPPINYIKILTPSNQSSWTTNSSHAITWIKNSSISYVNLYLDAEWYYVFTIVTGLPNTGSYNWSIPSPLATRNNYKIEIADYANTSCAGWSPDFTINDTANYLTITNPTSLSTWIAGSSYLIEWTTNISAPDVTLELYDNNSYVSEIGYTMLNTGSYYWSIPAGLYTSSTYEILLYCGYIYYPSYSSSNFTIIGNSNPITVTSPSIDSSWNVGSSYYIEWTTHTDISYVDISLYDSGGYVLTIATHWSTPVTFYPASINGNYNAYNDYQWKVPSFLSTTSNYQIKIADSSNSSSYALSPDFTIRRSVNAIDGYNIILICAIVVGVLGLGVHLKKAFISRK